MVGCWPTARLPLLLLSPPYNDALDALHCTVLENSALCYLRQELSTFCCATLVPRLATSSSPMHFWFSLVLLGTTCYFLSPLVSVGRHISIFVTFFQRYFLGIFGLVVLYGSYL